MANSWKFMFVTKKANSADHHLCKICGRFVSNMIDKEIKTDPTA